MENAVKKELDKTYVFPLQKPKKHFFDYCLDEHYCAFLHYEAYCHCRDIEMIVKELDELKVMKILHKNSSEGSEYHLRLRFQKNG